MTSTEVRTKEARVDLKLESVVIPKSNVDGAKLLVELLVENPAA